MGKMRPIQKKPFLLLELIIALGLIVTCLFPLLKPNIQLYQLSKKRLASCESYTMDRQLFCQIKRDLMETKYSWEQLKKGIVTKDYTLTLVQKTERDSLQKEGLLLEALTPYGSHQIFVERDL